MKMATRSSSCECSWQGYIIVIVVIVITHCLHSLRVVLRIFAPLCHMALLLLRA